MRATILALVLVASGAEAQRIRLSGPVTTSSPVTPTTPAASPGALSACAALAGAYGSATPEFGTTPSPYFCNGVTWGRVWTDQEGTVVSPDKTIAGGTFVSQAISGDFAFKANNRPVWDFGDGVNDEIVSEGASLRFNGSVKIAGGQSFSVDQISPTTAGGDLVIFPLVSTSRWVRIWPLGDAACVSGSSGGIQTRSGDGNRLYQCDGTTAYRISRVVTVPVAFDFPEVTNSTCVTASVTVASAAASDTLSVNADFALPADVSIGNVRTTAADTVELKLCNSNLTTPQNPDSGIYRFRLER